LSTQQSIGSNFEWVPVRLDHKGPLHRRRVLAQHPAICEKYQFDWSHEVVLVNGTMVTVKVAPPAVS
jgi:hypothetical protein